MNILDLDFNVTKRVYFIYHDDVYSGEVSSIIILETGVIAYTFRESSLSSPIKEELAPMLKHQLYKTEEEAWQELYF